jgi:CRP-like cAMP-binding protein
MSQLNWLPSSIRQPAHLITLDASEMLFRQGNKAIAIFEVERGRLRLIRHTVDSHSVVLRTVRKGELFAEAALFARAYQCDAIAVIASRVWVYPKSTLLTAFRSNPVLAERFMAVLSHQVQALCARLEERNIRSARERVLHHLALTAGPDGRTMSLDGTLMDLAAEIGLTHEVLYRTLADLERDGLIARSPRQLALRKRQRI